MKYLTGLLVIVAGIAIYLYLELMTCKSVADFRPAISHVQKFIGHEASFKFSVECTGKDIFDDCIIAKPINVTGQTVVLKERRNGTTFGRSYAIDWVEEVVFYVDLSDPEDWSIDVDNNVITFTAPKVEFDRILRNKNYLPYIIDRGIRDDENDLLNLIKKSHEVSANKTAEYLKQNEVNINGEMEKSIKEFVKNIIDKMGYPSGINIVVDFEKT
ncbi:MAG: hypothetical protein ACI910_002612 [Oleispira sp.]|jgi:hypothetical protein